MAAGAFEGRVRRARWVWAGVALGLAGCTVSAFAQPSSDGVRDAPESAPAQPAVLFQPGATTAGPWTVTPRVSSVRGYNDNVNLSPPMAGAATARPPVTSRYLTLTPEVSAVLPGEGIDKLELNLRLEATRFDNSPINNTNNAEGSLDGLKLLDERTALAWRLTAQDWHDAVGSTDLSLDAVEPDHFRAAALGAVLRHDSEDGWVRTEMEAALSRKRYRNHRDITRLGDADTRSLVARRLWTAGSPGGASADTPGDSPAPAASSGTVQRWLAELRLVGTDYPGYRGTGFMPLDNTDTRLMAGALWEPAEGASPAWTGTAKLGWQHKHSSAGRPGADGVTWDLVLHFQPRTTTGVDLASGRAAADAPGDDANAVWINQQSIAWTELWRPDLRSTVSLVTGRNGYRYSPDTVTGQQSRNDRVDSLEVSWRLDLRRDWQVGFNWSLARRHSSIQALEYTRRLASVMLAVGL